MERYKKYIHDFISKLKNVGGPYQNLFYLFLIQVQPNTILLATVVVTILVSVLISVGVSSKEFARRLGEHQDGQKKMTDMVEVMVNNMQLKEKEVFSKLKTNVFFIYQFRLKR